MNILRYYSPVGPSASGQQGIRLSAVGNSTSISELNMATTAVNNDRDIIQNRPIKTVPNSVKVSCVKHFQLYGMSSTLRTFNNRHPEYRFTETSVRRWKKTADDKLTPDIPIDSIFSDRRGRPNSLAKPMLQKVNEIVYGSRLAGLAIRANDVISIGNAVLTMNTPHLLKDNGGTLELTDRWARLVLKKLGYTLRKATTDKRIPSPAFLKETKLQFQHQIFEEVNKSKIPTSLVINCDQTPLSYVNAGNYTFEATGARQVPIAGKGDKRAITGTFSVTASGKFLPMQLIYTGWYNIFLYSIILFYDCCVV